MFLDLDILFFSREFLNLLIKILWILKNRNFSKISFSVIVSLERDYFLEAKEAKEYGLIDKVL